MRLTEQTSHLPLWETASTATSKPEESTQTMILVSVPEALEGPLRAAARSVFTIGARDLSALLMLDVNADSLLLSSPWLPLGRVVGDPTNVFHAAHSTYCFLRQKSRRFACLSYNSSSKKLQQGVCALRSC